MSEVLLRREEAVAYVTLNRPEVHNAFNEVLIAALTETLTQLSTDPTVRVVVISGAGKSFCAGADLDWMRRMAGHSREQNLADAATARTLFETLDSCPKVTIAQIHGAALGGGAGLVAACDLAVAEENTRFAFSEVRLGILPATIAPFVLKKIGMGHARALFVTGRRFSAEEALRFGLIQEIGSHDAVSAQISEALLASPDAVNRVKRLLRELPAADTAAALADARASDEGREGLSAFLEKRKPRWIDAG